MRKLFNAPYCLATLPPSSASNIKGKLCFSLNFWCDSDRKSIRLNSQSHSEISYAVFCLKKKKPMRIAGTGAADAWKTAPVVFEVGRTFARHLESGWEIDNTIAVFFF